VQRGSRVEAQNYYKLFQDCITAIIVDKSQVFNMPKRLIRKPGQLDIVEWFTGKSAKRHANYDISLCGSCNEIKIDWLINDILQQKHTL
jgi:hypothetical protein